MEGSPCASGAKNKECLLPKSPIWDLRAFHDQPAYSIKPICANCAILIVPGWPNPTCPVLGQAALIWANPSQANHFQPKPYQGRTGWHSEVDPTSCLPPSYHYSASAAAISFESSYFTPDQNSVSLLILHPLPLLVILFVIPPLPLPNPLLLSLLLLIPL